LGLTGNHDVTANDKSLIRFDFVEPSYLLAVGLVFFGAFVALGSDLGLEGSVLLISLVWGIHLTIGLAALRLSVIGLSRWRITARWTDPVLLISAGLLTSLVLAPVSFAIDQLLMFRGVLTDDEPLVSPRLWPIGIIEEWTEVVGPTLLVSLLLGFPAWWARRRTAEPVSTPIPTLVPEASAVPAQSSTDGSCLQRLPPALGTDLIAARSELQYVRIYTTRGDALILGALKDIAEQRDEGQLVHRAWWVSSKHVRTLRRRGTRCMLTLSNGLEVPVSRRRQQALVEQFGASATLNN
jgi:hypothetical protein